MAALKGFFARIRAPEVSLSRRCLLYTSVPPEFLGDQLDAVFEDIYPEAVKIGMVSSKGLIQVIGEKLRFYQAKNVVVDPVMVASSGSSLMKRCV